MAVTTVTGLWLWVSLTSESQLSGSIKLKTRSQVCYGFESIVVFFSEIYITGTVASIVCNLSDSSTHFLRAWDWACFRLKQSKKLVEYQVLVRWTLSLMNTSLQVWQDAQVANATHTCSHLQFQLLCTNNKEYSKKLGQMEEHNMPTQNSTYVVNCFIASPIFIFCRQGLSWIRQHVWN